MAYVNYYQCPKDEIEWADLWTCQCNDKCPVCNSEIEPLRSDEVNAPLAHEIAMQC